MFATGWWRAGGRAGVDDVFARQFDPNIGAEIMGRGKFGPQTGPWQDLDWQGWWGDEPPFRTPVFVMTHHARPSLTLSDTTFHFVSGDPAGVLDKAKAAAGNVYSGLEKAASTAISVASTAGLFVGMPVIGPGIPAGATVASVTDGTNFVLSANTTAAGTNTTLGSRSSVVISGGLSGSGAITKAGAGRVAVSGTGTYIGTSVTVNAGSLEIGAGTTEVRKIIISDEFVNETSCPNTLSEMIRWISNCSIGP